MNRRLRAALAAVTLTAALLVAPAATAAAAGGACARDGLAKAPTLAGDVGRDGTPVRETTLSDGTSVPVVVIHGWTGRSVHDDARTGAFSHLLDLSGNKVAPFTLSRSLIGDLQDVGGTSLYTFDYHDRSARWVTDPGIGPALAEALVCLAEAHGHPAVVVAHSMGGLATRDALSRIAGAEHVVSDVITYGTPNTGSVAAAAADQAALAASFTGAPGAAVAAFRSLLTLCGTVTTRSLDRAGACGMLGDQLASFDSDAGRALRSGSQQLLALPSWPADVDVHALYGDMGIEFMNVGWFGIRRDLGRLAVGDAVVLTDSARGGAADAVPVTCEYTANVATASADNLLEAFRLQTKQESRENVYTSLGGSPCFHGNLMRVAELGITAMGVVVDRVDAAAAAIRAVEDIPAELRGTWCTVDGSECVDFRDVLAEWPDARFETPGTRFSGDSTVVYAICYLIDLDSGCTMASKGIFDRIPAGTPYDCQAVAEVWGFERCDPDYTSEHDSSKPRLLHVPNHQHGAQYWDVRPMYLQE